MAPKRRKRDYVREHETPFEELAEAAAERLIGTKVPKKYQDKYGKVYTKETALEAGKAIAAAEGRKKYGKKQFTEMSQAGRRRAARGG